MYSPVLAQFMSRDPALLASDVLYSVPNMREPTIQIPPHDEYRYVRNNPINLTDPSGLYASDCAVEEKCSGACFIGKKATITKCKITKVVIEEGSDPLCKLITGSSICSELTKFFVAANKAVVDDPKKYPDGTWLINKCTDGCDCKSDYKLKKGPQTFTLKDRTIKSTGELGYPPLSKVVTCIVTISGTIDVDGDGFALVECEKAKK